MGRRTRSPFPAILGVVALSAASVAASSSSALLGVGVTVVRSCAVRATAGDRGLAHVDLTCVSGAASAVRRAGGNDARLEESATRLRLQVPTVPYSGTLSNDRLDVATVNF